MKKENIIGPKRILQYFRGKYMTEKWNFFPVVIFRIGIVLVELMPAIYFQKLVDSISSFTGTDKMPVLSVGIGLLLTIMWINTWSMIMRRLSDYLMINMSTNIMRKIYLECFTYINQHSYKFFANNFTGALIKKINKLVGAYDNITDVLTFEIAPIVLQFIGILVIISSKDLHIAGVLTLWVIVFSGIQYYLYKWNYPYAILANEKDSKLSAFLSDAITNNANIKIFASLKKEYKSFEKQSADRSKTWKIKWYRDMIVWTVTSLMMIAIEFIVFYMAIKYRALDILNLGFFILLQIYLGKLMGQLRDLGNIFRHLYKGFSESAEMVEILDQEIEIKDINNAEKLLIHGGTILFDNVKFTYDNDNIVFQNLCFKIKTGERVAFVGESGSGKTTIAKLLLRLYDIQGGAILIDGHNIAKVTQESLRDNISLVPQDPILFHRSLRENIAYGADDATEEQIIAASKMARCHKFIEKLAEGYDTLVGERGIKLSGGERQRVAIARAILANKPILVMDEATSALDSESESLIQEAMDEVMKNKTVIMIAHRLSTVMKMDRIIVMDQGKIIEEGSHKELLLKSKGTYKKLWDIQSGGFIE